MSNKIWKNMKETTKATKEGSVFLLIKTFVNFGMSGKAYVEPDGWKSHKTKFAVRV